MSFKNWGISALLSSASSCFFREPCLWSWQVPQQVPCLTPPACLVELGPTVPFSGHYLPCEKCLPGAPVKGSEGWGASQGPSSGCHLLSCQELEVMQRPQNGPSLLCVTLTGPALRDRGCPALPPPQGPTRYHKERYWHHVIPCYHKRRLSRLGLCASLQIAAPSSP